MTEKDNIKLKTDTLTGKSGSSAGVHVKRKRKIITKPAVAKSIEQSTPVKKVTKKRSYKQNPTAEVKSSKVSSTQETSPVNLNHLRNIKLIKMRK